MITKSMIYLLVFFGVLAFILVGCRSKAGGAKDANTPGDLAMSDKVIKTDEQWRCVLTPEQYWITRQGGTELPFTGKFYKFKGEGKYVCVACGNELFSSDAKFDSGTGWPSFYEPATKESITKHEDHGVFMVRTEIRCSRCGAHLGHVFRDGPPPTHLRYCINSAALKFVDQNDTGR